MSWQTFLANKKIKTHLTSKQELDGLRAVIWRDLTDASITALSSDRRFATANNAALQTATMAIACAGYRTSGMGHHQTTFEAAELALGADSTALTAYFDACRRKSNTVDYDRAHVATETESNEIMVKVKEFLQLTEDWIAQNHPSYQKT